MESRYVAVWPLVMVLPVIIAATFVVVVVVPLVAADTSSPSSDVVHVMILGSVPLLPRSVAQLLCQDACCVRCHNEGFECGVRLGCDCFQIIELLQGGDVRLSANGRCC